MTAPAAPDGASEPALLDVAGASVSGAAWTLVSRVTGFGRVAVTAAVLGPTYLGNTFQATNLLPNLVFYLLTGSLFANLLVPPLMRHIDAGEGEHTERLARGFLGVVLPVLTAVSVLAVLAGPVLLRLFSAGVADAGVATDQRRVGLLLLVLVMPQVPLYGIAFTGAAVMNAHGRFALATAAPVFENVGIMVTLGVAAVRFGAGGDLATVTTGQLVLLGAGATSSVGLHAAAQWWGARRCGVTLIPRWAWRDPEVRAIVDRAVPSLGSAGLIAGREFAILTVANRVAGGVVAFQVAYNFYNLAVAIGARTVAAAALPTLSRLHHDDRGPAFRDELVRALGLALFLTVPAAVACAVLAHPLAAGVAFGEMATAAAYDLVAAGLVALALGVVAETWFVMVTGGSYALGDARTPLRAMAVRTIVSLVALGFAATLDRPSHAVFAIGAAVSLGNLAGAGWLSMALLRRLPPGRERIAPRLARPLGAAAVMALPAVLAANGADALGDGVGGRVAAMLAGAAVGGVVYLATARLSRSPELATFTSAMSRH
jgi:putative peptidoglycan lipid II flippase